MSASQMMRTTRLQQISLAAALLCALSAGPAAAQGKADAAKTETKPSTGFLPPASSDAKVLDSIYVVVNDEVITRNEVNGRVDQVLARMKAQNAQLPDIDDLRRQVVEAMITERAQVQLAREYGVKVDDTTLDRTIQRIAENQKMSVQDMRNQMEKEGLPFASFREEIRNEIVLQRLREHEVDAKIQVSDAEV
ncbi:MAG: SurA N-terminal domain-containing protein, partial [Telluria sp.]